MASNKLVVTQDYTRTLVDEFVKLRAQMSKLAAKEDMIKAVLLAEMKKKKRSVLSGEKFMVTKTEEERRSLSKTYVEQYLTLLQMKKCTVITSYEKLTSRNLE